MEGKKSRINNNIDLVDRISALPDYILGHILSFLPTNKAVATSILSKRWKFAWVTVHSLEFDNPMKFFDIMKEKEEEIMEFVRFVNRVLLLNDVGSLIKFSLTCNCVSISPQIISWINTAITRNVHHLYLSVENTDMPASLFSCDSLRSLVLHGFMYIRDPIEVCLTRLESLEIQCVRFDSEETCEKLISGCPILHYLNLWIENYRGDADDDITCIISSASLRHLEIYFMNRSRLKLKAPSVEYLRLGGYYISEIFVEKSLSSLVEAYFNIPLDEHDFLNNSILEVVRAFDCARFLTLSAGVMRALSRDTVKLSSKLKRLVKLETNILYCDWSSLRDLIQNSDNLEVLTINQFEKVRGVNSRDRSKWISLVEVPRCLSKSLKKIVFEGYHGIVEDEHEMICYMLTHGSVLEDVRITLVGKMTSSKFKSVQKIGECPRKSPCCLVKIFGGTSNGNVEVCFSA